MIRIIKNIISSIEDKMEVIAAKNYATLWSHSIYYQLNMPLWDFHFLRYTHTTNLLSNGADIKYVQKRLGQKNIEMTLGIYQHITDEIKERNIQILNNL